MRFKYTLAVSLPLLALMLYCVPYAGAFVDVRDSTNKIVLGDVEESDIPKLVEYYIQGGPEAEYAGINLKEFGEKSVPELLKTLESGKADAAALSMLAQVMNESAIVPVSRYINDDDDTVASLARQAVVETGDKSVPLMLGKLDDPDTHDAALEILERAALTDASKEALVKTARNGDGVMRGDAAYLLGLHKFPGVESDIVRLVTDDDPYVRINASNGYRILHETEPDGYDRALVYGMLKDSEPAVKLVGIQIAGSTYDETMADLLLGMVNDKEDREVVARASELLAGKGDGRVTLPVIGLLDQGDKDLDFQTSLIWSLGALKAAEAVPYLLEPFESGDPVPSAICRETFEALAEIGEPVDLKPFFRYLEEGDPHYNSTNPALAMMSSLARPGDDDVIEALEQYRDKATVSQRQTIDETLKRIR